jgi:hypothetical protein
MNPTTVSWVDPTTNVDGTPLASGEITGYKVGVREGGTAGTYTSFASVPAGSTSCALSALSPALPASGSFEVAVQAESTTNGNSAWSAEASFTLVVSPPNPPTSLSVS